MSGRFAAGERVRVRAIFPPGHVRTPYYARGKEGIVDGLAAYLGNPETMAYGAPPEPELPVYRVRLKMTELWPDYAGSEKDSTVVDLYEHWLEPASGRKS